MKIFRLAHAVMLAGLVCGASSAAAYPEISARCYTIDASHAHQTKVTVELPFVGGAFDLRVLLSTALVGDAGVETLFSDATAQEIPESGTIIYQAEGAKLTITGTQAKLERGTKIETMSCDGASSQFDSFERLAQKFATAQVPTLGDLAGWTVGRCFPADQPAWAIPGVWFTQRQDEVIGQPALVLHMGHGWRVDPEAFAYFDTLTAEKKASIRYAILSGESPRGGSYQVMRMHDGDLTQIKRLRSNWGERTDWTFLTRVRKDGDDLFFAHGKAGEPMSHYCQGKRIAP